MNVRKMKLAVAIGLLNNPSVNALVTIKEAMLQFTTEVGRFLGFSLTKEYPLDAQRVNRSYSLMFENCAIELDLVSSQQNSSQIVRDFRLSQ